MAFTAAANATQRVGNYAPGSLAAQPRRFAGGVRKRGESPDQMANRMDAGYMASAMQGGTTAPTRADNIAKARADGTFDAKRNAFNAANQGSFMDAAGNIGPKAEMPAPPASAPPSPTPPSAPAPNPTATAPSPTATAPAKPKGPATFDGKSKADFFGAAMNKYGPTAGVSAYKDQNVMAVAANDGKPLPASKPAPVPAAKPAGMVAAATPAKPYSGPMARPAGQVDAKPAAPTVTPAPKPAGIVAEASTKAPAAAQPRVTINANGMPTYHHPRPGPNQPGNKGVYTEDGQWIGAKTRDENNNEVFIGDKGSNKLKEVSPGNFDVVPQQMPGAPPPGKVYQDWRPNTKRPTGFAAAANMK